MLKRTLLSLSLLSCSALGYKPAINVESGYKAEVEFVLENHSYFALEQKMQHSDLPKYDGNLSIYSAKHQPTVLEDYFVYSDNTSGSMNIYVFNRITKQKTYITTMRGIIDPHKNASIIKLANDYLYVIVSSRGTRSSSEHFVIDKDFINVVSLGSHYMAYPQPFYYKGQVGIMYNHYNDDGVRTMRAKTPYGPDVAITENTGHYFISSLVDNVLYVVYNDHGPYGNSDTRENVRLIKSSDGGLTWSNPELLYDSRANNVYLKSIDVDAGLVKVLFIEAESHEPAVGNKILKFYDGNSVNTITDIHHNYATGYSYGNMIVIPISNDKSQASGDLHVYTKKGHRWALSDIVLGEFNYAKRTHYSNSHDGVVTGDDGIYDLSFELIK